MFAGGSIGDADGRVKKAEAQGVGEFSPLRRREMFMMEVRGQAVCAPITKL